MSGDRVNWQPIDALPMISSLIGGWLETVERQYASLDACRENPHVLDNATVNRVIEVYSTQAGDLLLYEEQFSRWKGLALSRSQRRDVDHLAAQLPEIKEKIMAVLTLAEEPKGGTIEALMNKSDLELGLGSLIGSLEKTKNTA